MPRGYLNKEQRKRGAEAIRRYWSQFNPEERSIEMKRRANLRKKKWLESQNQKVKGTGGGSFWSKLSAKERSQEMTRRRKVATRNRRNTTTESPFPPEMMTESPMRISIRNRIEAIEAAVAALKADLGL